VDGGEKGLGRQDLSVRVGESNVPFPEIAYMKASGSIGNVNSLKKFLVWVFFYQNYPSDPGIKILNGL
jgi:hypothetical protein